MLMGVSLRSVVASILLIIMIESIGNFTAGKGDRHGVTSPAVARKWSGSPPEERQVPEKVKNH
jgi:hypothetical protein